MKTLKSQVFVLLVTISSSLTITVNTHGVFPRHHVGFVHHITLTRDEQEYLDAHNAIRDKKCVPHLSWDPKLAKYAKKWAHARREDCNYHHHSGGPYGENQMWEQYDELYPRDIVNIWADEERNWDYNVHKCKCKPETVTCQCGHYVALVWKSAHSMGCANVTCNNEKGIFVVCEYDHKGWARENPLNPRPGH